MSAVAAVADRQGLAAGTAAVAETPVADGQGLAATVAEALAQAKTLRQVSDTPRLDCQLLLAHLLAKPRHWLLAHGEAPLGQAEASRYQRLLRQRMNGMPVAYLLGHKDFWTRRFKVSPATLVPRPETELLVSAALQHLDAGAQMVGDLGTGCGALAVSLAAERPAWTLVATDISSAALAVARQNAAGLDNLLLVQGNWLQAFRPASFDLLLANPPYLAAKDPHLPALAAEPREALVAGEDGLDAFRQIAAQAHACLKPGGMLLLEQGASQALAVRALLQAAGFAQPQTLQDIQGHPRALLARTRA